jgi:hypothetical protein
VHGALSGPYANVNVSLLIDGSAQGRVCVSSDTACTLYFPGPHSLGNFQGVFDETLTYNFFPGSPMDLWVSIAGNAGPGSTVNLANTVGIGLDLPAGWSYTSASGVFLQQTAAAAPEPNSISLFALCLVGLAGAHWRRSLRWHPVRAHPRVTA